MNKPKAARGRGGNRGIAGRTGDKPKKEAILDLGPLVNTRLSISMSGGRECSGILKGYDPLQNLVLDDAVDESGRRLGLLVVRGTGVSVIAPERREIDNPF